MKRMLFLIAAMLIFFSQFADAQVVLNEIKVRPRAASGTPPNGFFHIGGEEYVELYNNGCDSVDLSGYYIATRQLVQGVTSGGTIRLPKIVIQPKSHLVIASASAAPSSDIDLVLRSAEVTPCLYNRSFGIANIDGWVALYNATGTPINGVYWSSAPGNLKTFSGDFGGTLCVPSGSPVTSLPNPQQMDSTIMEYAGGNFSSNNNSTDSLISREKDGTGKWVRNLPSSIRKSDATKNCNGGNCYSLPEISWNGTQLFATATGDKFQWYLNGVLIPNTDSSLHTPVASGLYTVMVTDKECSLLSTAYNFVATNLISFSPSSSKSLLVYPNPAQHNVWIKLDRKPGERMDLQMFNAVGGLVKSLQSGQQQLDLNVADLPAGTYFIRVSAPGYREVKKIQIAK